MLIYTSNADGDKLDHVQRLGMGILLANSANRGPSRRYRDVPCALDNGAFQCWRRGFPFQADVFRRTLAEAYRLGLSLDFIVCPDIVAAGRLSLEFSLQWRAGELVSAPRVAFVVQDGMTCQDLSENSVPDKFSHLFVGGTLEWKWKTAPMWVDYAHYHKMKAHIGRCGTYERLKQADAMKADSVDSSSFVRNDSWHIIEEFMGITQHPLFTTVGKDQ